MTSDSDRKEEITQPSDLCFIRLESADGCFREFRCSRNYIPRTVHTAIAPLVQRTYEFRSEHLGALWSLPAWVDEPKLRKKLDEYDNVTIRIYRERVERE